MAFQMGAIVCKRGGVNITFQTDRILCKRGGINTAFQIDNIRCKRGGINTAFQMDDILCKRGGTVRTLLTLFTICSPFPFFRGTLGGSKRLSVLALHRVDGKCNRIGQNAVAYRKKTMIMAVHRERLCLGVNH